MLFSRDEENDGWFLVDQDRYCEIDHFEPCNYCRQLIENPPLEEHEWREGHLCDPCQTNLEITSAIDMARRPELPDLEGRVITSMTEKRLAQAAEMKNLGRTITPGDLLDLY